MFDNFCVNCTLYEMHVLRITLAYEMSDFRHFTQFFAKTSPLYLQYGGVIWQ